MADSLIYIKPKVIYKRKDLAPLIKSQYFCEIPSAYDFKVITSLLQVYRIIINRKFGCKAVQPFRIKEIILPL